MQTRRTAFFAATLTLAAAAGTARASDERLLVVVESGPGVAVDARDVRQTIGAELGVPVVAPSDAAAAGASNVLIVAVDKSDIRMSLRGSAAGLVARTIPSPVDRPARLREIGWLAGNLARDQVSGIVAVPADRAAAPKGLVVADTDAEPAIEPPPVAPAAIVRSATSSLVSEPAATLSQRPPQTVQGPHWTITAAGGPSATFFPSHGGSSGLGNVVSVEQDTDYQLEVQRQSSPESLLFGAAVDIESGSPFAQLFGVAGFVGSSWRHRRWFLETTAGLGLELARLPQTSYEFTSSSVSGTMSSSTVTPAIQPILYLRGIGTVGLQISDSLDLVARAGVHVASGGFLTDFLSATVGLRFVIP